MREHSLLFQWIDLKNCWHFFSKGKANTTIFPMVIWCVFHVTQYVLLKMLLLTCCLKWISWIWCARTQKIHMFYFRSVGWWLFFFSLQIAEKRSHKTTSKIHLTINMQWLQNHISSTLNSPKSHLNFKSKSFVFVVDFSDENDPKNWKPIKLLVQWVVPQSLKNLNLIWSCSRNDYQLMII